MNKRKKSENSTEYSLDDLLQKLFEKNTVKSIDHIEPLINSDEPATAETESELLEAITTPNESVQSDNQTSDSDLVLVDELESIPTELPVETFVFSGPEINLHRSVLEAALFTVGSQGLKINEMKRILDHENVNSDYLHDLLKKMKQDYLADPTSGIVVEKFDDVYKITTKVELYDHLRKLIKPNLSSALTNTLMEVLSLIAYNGPCPKSLIFKVRNVDPTNSIDKLIKLGLIYQYKRAETPGKPWLYKTTPKFFDITGIRSKAQLPKVSVSLNGYLDDETNHDSEEMNEQPGDDDFFNINRKNNLEIDDE
ncbi:segregation and condensation protein B [Mycoplasmoides fastidiosum]|uniref:Segregation and condensation protein B n=1 Tax=Mycoplasmoides fastidiosum TaxID=92758 RepID=A0ABU0LZK6_9BACT|nr:SMC-Scp complex subunit ScpB [Mycoplasmoides fastidiosum]MDQ0514145.1 segregation and condensation protein B [Mycoplasmoides fastidiosum]UUD37447.1 SMC-Scp complex subunit ScpB [Mycoplasmoides fastidiosum]